MPIFEYTCKSCEQHFEAVVQSSTVPECPQCKSRNLKKELSVFAINKGGETAHVPSGCGSCGDPRGPGACSLN